MSNRLGVFEISINFCRNNNDKVYYYVTSYRLRFEIGTRWSHFSNIYHDNDTISHILSYPFFFVVTSTFLISHAFVPIPFCRSNWLSDQTGCRISILQRFPSRFGVPVIPLYTVCPALLGSTLHTGTVSTFSDTQDDGYPETDNVNPVINSIK